MSIITPVNLLTLTDHTGKMSKLLLSGLDPGAQEAAQLLADVDSIFASDRTQRREWETPAIGLTQAAGGNTLSATGLGAGGLSGLSVGAGSFGAGNGLLSRQSLLPAALYAWLENGMRALIQRHAAQDLIAGVSDLSSYAAHFNATAAYSALFSPDFATAYYYAYGAANQLAPASVFMPAGVTLAAAGITAANAATLTAGAFPVANGYASPAPAADAYGNPSYVGGLPMPQGFAPLTGFQADITTAINGTCACTVTGPNQAGVSRTWAANLDGLAVGATVSFAPATTGDRLYGLPTAIAVSGTATSGAFSLLSLAERTVS